MGTVNLVNPSSLSINGTLHVLGSHMDKLMRPDTRRSQMI